jgi:hypothetical protein
VSESPLDRILSYRLARVSDCWGNRRAVRTGKRNGVWFVDGPAVQAPDTTASPLDPAPRRRDDLARLRASGRFSAIELATLEALAAERLTLNEIAERDGCSRQAVVARLAGNSKGQGGILKKARAVLAREDATSPVGPM